MSQLETLENLAETLENEDVVMEASIDADGPEGEEEEEMEGEEEEMEEKKTG